MDTAVERLITRLNEEGTETKEQMSLLRLGIEYLKEAKKLRPRSVVDGDGMSIDAMREIIRETMDEEHVVRVPVKKSGRPTKAEAVIRKEYKLATGGAPPQEDAALRQALGRPS